MDQIFGALGLLGQVRSPFSGFKCEAAQHSDAPAKRTSLRASSKNISSKSSVFFIMCFLKGSFYKGSVFFFVEKITTRRYTERAVLLGVSSSIRG